MDSLAFQFLISQLHSIPMLVAYSVVLSLIVMRRDTIPVDPLLTGIAFSAFIAVLLFSAAANYWRMSVMQEGMSVIELSSRLALFGVLTATTQLAAVIFLGIGIFRRNPRLSV